MNVTTRAEGGPAIAEVHDNGPGVSSGEVKRLFERFHHGGTTAAIELPLAD